MKLTKEQIARVLEALQRHSFMVYAEMYWPPDGHEPWPVVEYEDTPDGLFVEMGDVESVLSQIEL